MGARIRTVILVAVVLGVGTYLGSSLSQFFAGDGGVPAAPGRAPQVGERVRVEVLNGGGKANMARSATDRLRDQGFDVVYYGNADDFDVDSSLVLDRSGNLEWARAVADALGIRQVQTRPDSNLYLDVTVVLGQEWAPEGPDAVENARDTLPWWDPRRLFQKRPGTPDGGGEGARMVDPGDEEGGE